MADSGCEDTVPSMAPSLCKLPEESDASMRQRLFTSLSQSFPHSQLYRALHGGENIILAGDNSEDEDDDSLCGDPLSSSCFATIRLDKRDSDDIDDDLQSLEWLQREDLLKNIGGERLDQEEDQKENADIKPDIALLQQGLVGQAHSIPYLPSKQINSKPPYSFSCLIFMAVEQSPQKRLPVKDIYNWILTQFPYFQNAPTGWKNSVRHNLSLNKCFKKVDKDKGQSVGKGSLWCIDPAYRPNLLQALRKTPYHPYHQLQMTSTLPQNYNHVQCLPGRGTVLPLTQRPVPNTVSPHLFPFLSRRLAQTSLDVDNEMKDVAQTLVSLKGTIKQEREFYPGEDIGPTWRYQQKRSYSYNNPRKRSLSPVVVTPHPFTDHAYSSTQILDDDAPSLSSSSSIDEEYEFGTEADEEDEEFESDDGWGDTDTKDEVDGTLPSHKRLKIDLHRDNRSTTETEEDEQKKLHDGANALLNLAGLLFDTRESSNSSSLQSSPRKAGKKSPKTKNQRPTKTKKKKETKKSEGNKSSVSGKRKNAGKNDKYKDFSPTVKRSKSANVSKNSTPYKKEKGVANKLPNTVPRVKTTSSNSKFRQASKNSNVKRKLKLSKNFSSSVKSEKDEDSKVNKKPTKAIRGKKSLFGARKLNAESSASAKSSESSAGKSSSETSLKSSSSQQDASPSVTYNNNNNNEDKTADSSQNVDEVGKGKSHAVTRTQSVTAAGDAPVKASRSSSRQNLAPTSSSYESPHFTRFSKKKASMF